MHPRSSRSETLSHSVSSSIGPQTSGRERLPVVPYPDCGVAVKRFVSRTEGNPGRPFYKCVNMISKCNFWKWENEYLVYLRNANVVIPSIESELVQFFGTLESQLVKLRDELKNKCEDDKRQFEALFASLDNINIKLYNHMYVIIALLVVVIGLLIVVIGIHK
ncbi:hypothetical protein LUZ63_001398 [Rhynchospora breviuscula]|uniref:GRF-type domain-containing protein n=1 Tax=Rhynchospora breviuscula TaxID=2022672 RepID=A0A9Q0CWS4_9POAL|nr:hypothetical protein LUZ63_001398 [Rhynchospora breviuscula]